MKEQDKWIMGLPYIGSKQSIAQKIVDLLPPGHRIVDVFGGGGAMTLAMANSGKWDQVLYNDLNTGLVSLFRRVVTNNLPIGFSKWAVPDRDRFEQLKQKDNPNAEETLALLIWSFGYSMRTFLFARSDEQVKEAIIQAFLGQPTGTVFDQAYQFASDAPDWKHRQRKFSRWMRENQALTGIPDNKLASFRKMHPLAEIARVRRLYQATNPCLQSISFANADFQQLMISPDDVVYLDPPYVGTDHRYGEFDEQEFIDWYLSLPNQHIYISEYSQLPGTEVISEVGVSGHFKWDAGTRRELLLKVKKAG